MATSTTAKERERENEKERETERERERDLMCAERGERKVDFLFFCGRPEY